ncbi:hypothetical protein BCR42DRAFT_438949 [Absidia repens]|uniref:Cryptococcal mannosyltransferase 1-domain-containing protein n=1 Tax=Absidia repens TaxID=90262 RepID=A0A1X2ICJ2_9FUNG|nr:hypothetical protein BCR42DRAFT_438949 [Absidia repens]
MSKKLIVIQLIIVFLLGFFFMCSVKVNHAETCTSDFHLCRSDDMDISFDDNDILLQKPSPEQQITIPPVKRTDFPYTIVTASSANHLCSLENFLYSLQALRSQVAPEDFPRVVVYNIGMNRTQLPVLDQLRANGLIDDVETFDYFKYPRFWDVAINAGEYAWKTGIVNEARIRYGGTLVWLDAGNMVTADFLRNIPSTIKQHGGFWSPRSSYTMGRWTHQGMYDYYGANARTYARKINCNGAAVGFDTTNSTIVDDIIIPWYQCGLDKNCIAPPGSSRKNHRQDQAALTFLAYKNGHSCSLAPARFDHLQIHRDVACRSSLLEMEVSGSLQHPSAVDFPKWYRSDTLELYNHPEWRYPEDKVPAHIKSLIEPPQYL